MVRCRVCGAQPLEVFFEQSAVPVHCNVLAATAEEARATPRGDIELGYCGRCSMIHNVAFDATLLRYGADYENSLHFSPRFNAYAEDLARRLLETWGLDGARIVEIGCGKGDFLAMLAGGGRNDCLGFDASYEGGQDHAGVRVLRTAFDPQRAADPPADLVVARHVLEHVEDPGAFVAALAAITSRDGTVYLEVPNALYTLRDLGIWDIIYEHCSYFTAASMARLLVGHGLRPVRSGPAFGGQFLAVEARRGAAAYGDTLAPAVEAIGTLVAAFGRAFTDKVAGWSALLAERLQRGERLVVWGAGSKGVTFLNTVERGADVHAVVDINERKQGRFVPGTGQCVVGPEAAARAGIDAVLVMNPVYRDEIAEQLAGLGVAAAILPV